MFHFDGGTGRYGNTEENQIVDDSKLYWSNYGRLEKAVFLWCEKVATCPQRGGRFRELTEALEHVSASHRQLQSKMSVLNSSDVEFAHFRRLTNGHAKFVTL